MIYDKILVTGGSGLVGKNLQTIVDTDETVRNKFIFLSSKDGNLENLDEVKNLFEKYKPDCVLHLAANVGGLFKNIQKNFELLTSNMKINQNVSDCALEFKVKKCISCLSTCIFPDKIQYPIDETMIHDGPPNHTNFGYSYAKRYVEIFNRAANDKQKETLFVSIIPCNIYGMFDNFHLEDSHVIPGLIHKAYLAKEKKTPFVVFGSGTPLRQFIYAKDLARLVLNVIQSYDSCEPIILCVDEKDEISIADAAEAIRKAFKIETNLVFDKSYADGQFRKPASNQKIRKLWPDFKFTKFEQGIQETVEWFIKNYQNARK